MIEYRVICMMSTLLPTIMGKPQKVSMAVEEVEKALSKMKNGEDKITVDMTKAVGDTGVKCLNRLLHVCWDPTRIPDD